MLTNPTYGCGVPPRLTRDTPPSVKVGTNFADKRRLLGRCSHGDISYHSYGTTVVIFHLII
jgi:hypothetical protein